MARKSHLEHSTETITEAAKKPDAPSYLTDEQATHWNDIFDNFELGWIGPESYSMVVQLCRHLAEADYVEKCRHKFIAKARDESNEFEISTFNTLNQLRIMFDREVRASTSLKTKLRLTNQSLRSDKSDKPVAYQRAWEMDDDIELVNDPIVLEEEAPGVEDE